MSTRTGYTMIVVFVAGVFLGLVQIFLVSSPWDHIYSDMNGYIDKARRLFEEGMVPFDTFFPLGTAYLYSVFFFFLDDPVNLYVLAIFQVVCVAASHVVIGLTAQELFKNERVSIFTAVASLCYWPLTGQTTFFMSEPIFMLLCLSAQYCFIKMCARGPTMVLVLLCAVCVGIASITKTQGLVFLISMLVLGVIGLGNLKWLSAVTAITLVVISLHSWHISELLDRRGFFFSANGAFNLYLGQSGLEATGGYDLENNMFFLFYNNNSFIDKNLSPTEVHLASVLDQEYFMDRVVDRWQDDPGRQVLRMFVSAFELFSTEPHWPLRNVDTLGNVERVFKMASLLVIYLPLLIAISVAINQRCYRWELAVLLLPVLGIVCASALTFGQPRYLVPFMPNIIAVAAFAWVTLLPVRETQLADHP